MKTLTQIKAEIKKVELENRMANNFNGAGTVTLEDGEMISSNGAIQEVEDLLTENGIKYTVRLD